MNQGFVGINTETPSEAFDVVGGNAKIGSNLYVMSNLGIGKSNPAFALDIVGSINFTGSFNQNGLTFTGSRWTSNNQGVIYNFTSSNVGIGTNALNEKFTLSNGNAIMYSNLYVMNFIGIGKSNPGYALDVNGDINMTGSGVIRQNGSPAVFSQWSNNAGNVFLLGSNVGIGLSNPTNPLHVIGNTLVQGSIGTLGLTVGRRNATIVSGTPGASGAGAYDASSNLLFTIPASGNTFRFNVNSSTVAVIDGSGNVGLGTVAPAYKLDVVGNSAYDGKIYFNNTALNNPATGLLGGTGDKIILYQGTVSMQPYSIGMNASTLWNSGPSGTFFRWYSAGTERFRINSDGSAWLQGALTQNSDRRIKANISIIQDPLNKVQNITGYTYTRSDSPSNMDIRYMGLIAQEVQEIAPEVIVAQSNNLLSIDYAGLSGLYVECIKALTRENTEIKQRLSRLESIIQT
jgi:hypothetical protein